MERVAAPLSEAVWVMGQMVMWVGCEMQARRRPDSVLLYRTY